MALKAAFWSSGSVVHLVGSNDDPRKFYPKAEVIELRLSATAFDRLIGFLSQSFLRHDSKGRAQASPGLYGYSRFYPSNRKFSLLNTCNTWVAQTLETAGLPLSASRVVTAGQLAEQLDSMKTSSLGVSGLLCRKVHGFHYWDKAPRFCSGSYPNLLRITLRKGFSIFAARALRKISTPGRMTSLHYKHAQ